MKKIFFVTLWLAAMLLSCQTAPTVAPTTLQTQASLTVVPTNLPAATASATEAPLPQVSSETFIGTWVQFDPSFGGNNYLIYSADGTYEVQYGPQLPGVLASKGKLMLEQDVVTLYNDQHCPTGEKYRITFIAQQAIRYDLVETKCDFMAENMEKLPRWMRLPYAP